METKYFLIATLLILSVGCEEFTPGTVDVDAGRAAILAADQAWSETGGDLEAFISFFAEDARFLPPDGPQANGRDEIRQSFSALAALPGFSLSWSANFSDVSSSGDLGYSVGTFEMTVDGPDGRPATRTGTYTTVWKKQNDGQWKVVSDIPNFDSPAAQATVAQDSTEEQQESLYDRLGGLAPISVVVSDFIAVVVPDPFLNENPAVDASRTRVPAPYLTYQVTALVCQATGGPCQYGGRGMLESHAELYITEEEWDRMVVLFRGVLAKHSVPEKEAQELLDIIDSTKADIVVAASGE